jgi:hypothetical protein
LDRFSGDRHGAGDIGAKVQQVAVEQLVGLTGRELEPSSRRTTDGRTVAGASIADGEPYELLDGDLLHLGTDVTCTVAIPAEPIQGER